jgi:lipopolysaccharide heptosyltransferase II
MDRVAFIVYRLIAAIVGALPLKTGWHLGHILGRVGYLIGGPYRRLALHNLRIAFPEKSDEERRTIARNHFALLGANLFSSLKLARLSREEIEACVRVEGLENMDEQRLAGGGFIFVISHIGNWEMFAHLSPIFFRCKVGTVYQALGNRFIDAEVRRSRARLGLALFERKEGFSAASKFIREGGAVGVLIDQHAGDAGLWCPFFNRLASTSTLASTLALRTDGWLMPAAVYSDGPGRWRCIISERVQPRDGDAAEITVRLNETLEQQIQKQPEDWFWVHNRWKTPRPKFLLATYKRGIKLSSSGAPLKPFRIVVRSSNWLGDAVMSMPAVRAIKEGRPDAHVTLLTSAKLADFWQSVPGVDEVLSFTSEETIFDVARKLRGKFEVAIVLPNSFRTGLEAWLAGIPRRVGYPGHRRAWLLNQVLKPKKSKKSKPQRPAHQAEHYLAIAAFVGAGRAELTQPTSRHVRAEGERIRLGVCPGAEYGPAKRWLPERFAEVMRTIHAQTGCEWVIFGVEKDRPVADTIIRECGEIPCVDLVGKTTLTQLIEELRRCTLLLTNDTGTMHLAASLGVPVVAIFGSTEPALTGPVGANHTVIRHHVECSPCFLRDCPLDFRCMKRVTAGEVIGGVERQLAAVNQNTSPPSKS